MVRLESDWTSLLQNGLMGCVQPLPHSGVVVVVVVMVTRRRVVVVVVVHRLVDIVVILLPEEVGVEVSAGEGG